jgi:hypothetical protein
VHDQQLVMELLHEVFVAVSRVAPFDELEQFL